MEERTDVKTVASRPNVFRNKNYSLLFYGILVSNVAHVLFGFAISIYVYEVCVAAYTETMASFYQGLYLMVSGLVLLIFMPIGGVFADRFDKVKTMWITDFIRGATILAVALLIVFDFGPKTTLVGLFAMAIILNINAALFSPASSSLLRFILKEEELQQGAALLQTSSGIQNIVGLILAGILYAAVGVVGIALINGVAYMISAITEIFIHYDKHAHSEGGVITVKSVLKDIAQGFQYVIKEKAIMVIITMAVLLNFFFHPIFAIGLTRFIKTDLINAGSYLFSDAVTPEQWLSYISIAFSVAAIIMSVILSGRKTKASYAKDLKIALGSFSLPALLVPVLLILYYAGSINESVVLVGVTALMFLIGFGNIAFNVPIGVVMQKNIDKAMLGKVSSLMGVMTQALMPIASLLGGLAISLGSPIFLYAFCGAGILLVTLWYITNKQADRI